MSLPLSQRPPTQYRGRFAPSPSGLLHFGSLVTALASFLDAKSHQGRWLVRIEDIDPPRELKNAASNILRTLDAYGLHWDEPVLYQSKQSSLYNEVLSYLAAKNLTYACQCTRMTIKAMGGIYQGQCRSLKLAKKKHALRVINDVPSFHFSDLIQGQVNCDQHLAQEDYVVLRKDGLFAYQLAVVVDDIYQGITHVIRGCDLLEPTARQLNLYSLLTCTTPAYGHIPLVVTEQGYKLSKQNKAPAIDINNPQHSLISALKFLGQQPANDLLNCSVDEVISWAISHWNINQVPKKQQIMITSCFSK